MLNKKVILINGISRSGSNILWNIMQSHPLVCSPVGETNRVLHPQIDLLKKCTRFLYVHCPTEPVKRFVDRRLYQWKLKNLEHAANKWKTEDELYSVEEVQDAILCTKSLNNDIYLTDLFYSMYENLHTIGLVRNGYALCEGKIRRGLDPGRAGRIYARYMMKIIEDSNRLKNYTIVKFEDIMNEPFAAAERLYEFCELQPATCTKLRLKPKEVSSTPEKTPGRYGYDGEKFWFDRTSINDLIDVDIDKSKERLLSEGDRKSFERNARSVLEYFSYA